MTIVLDNFWKESAINNSKWKTCQKWFSLTCLVSLKGYRSHKGNQSVDGLATRKAGYMDDGLFLIKEINTIMDGFMQKKNQIVHLR